MNAMSILRTSMYVLSLCVVQKLLDLTPKVDMVTAKTLGKYIYNLHKNVSIDLLPNIPSVLLLHRWL